MPDQWRAHHAAELAGMTLLAKIDALRAERRSLQRRLNARQQDHHGYLDLQHRLTALTTKQLRLERRAMRQGELSAYPLAHAETGPTGGMN